jgi:Subtilase family
VKRNLSFISLLSVVALVLAACGGGGGSSNGGTPPITTVTPTPLPPSGGGGPSPAPQSVSCPTTGSSPTSVAFTTGAQDVKRAVPSASTARQYVPGALAVTYASDARLDAIDAVAGQLHGAHTGDLHLAALNMRIRVLTVDPSRVDAAITQLRSTRGVQSVSRIAYRHRMSVSSNDPYFNGFGVGAPFFEASSSPGQWDMHVMHIDTAWNAVSSSAPVAGAPIAIVDTGVDVTHPELSGGKIIRTECFVSYPNAGSQTTGTFVTDTDGHGTDVAGIADANTGNGLGFASPAFGAPMLAYRIFPTTPSGGCEGSNPPAQCDSNTLDEASAIDDAVAHGAKVINLSLGAAPPCPTNDAEYQAVESAISKGVVVVAAAGNESKSALDCPAADPGVIAVGATTLNDAVSPAKEAVASYSNFLSTNGGGHYVVAPGGDPNGSGDGDDLHWIENIYSSTAVQPGTCTPDFKSTSSTKDCRILIAGTSQATPHVTGVVSLILRVKPSYSPSQVAAALCNSATDISDSKQGCGRVDAAAAVDYAKTH